MPMTRPMRAGVAAAVALAAVLGAGCSSSGGKKPDKITQELLTEPKEALFAKGKALIAKKKYDEGRKYLNYVFETYPNETVGREALLMVADSYFQQKTTASYTEARYRYRHPGYRVVHHAHRDEAGEQEVVVGHVLRGDCALLQRH